MSFQNIKNYKYLMKFIKICENNTRQFTSSVINLSPRYVGKLNKTAEDAETENELKTLEEIENSLFDNKKHKPVNFNDFTKKMKKEINIEKYRQFEQERNLKNLVNNNELGFSYEKLKINDPLLGKLFLTARSKKNKKQNGLVIEGWRLILEALNCGLKMQTLLFDKSENLKPIINEIRKQKNSTKIYKVPQQSLRTWSTLTTCPGLIAIFEQKTENNKNENIVLVNNEIIPISVICDNVREPNNLGSIIRTCAAIPCYEVIVMKGCCDPWETKSLRGGCGGQFRINIKDNITWENLNGILPDTDKSIFIAENNLQKAINYPVSEYSDIQISNTHNCLVIGGETEGISKDAYEFLKYGTKHSCCINIPLAKGIDSLNTSSALTLILFEMRRHFQNLVKNKITP